MSWRANNSDDAARPGGRGLGWGGIGQPGQREIRALTPESETAGQLKALRALRGVMFGLWVCFVIIAVLARLHWVLWVIGVTASLGAAWQTSRYIRFTWGSDDKDVTGRTIAIALVVPLGAVTGALVVNLSSGGYSSPLVWPVGVWAGWGILLVVMAGVVPQVCAALYFVAQVVDPSSPSPRAAIKRLGPVVPFFTQEPEEYEDGIDEDDIRQMIEERVNQIPRREVARPVLVRDGRNGGNGRGVLPTPGIEERVYQVQAAPPPEFYDAIMSPGGAEVKVTDLATFCRVGVRDGTSWRTWEARGWNYDQWGAVMDTLAGETMAIVEPRQPRCTSRFLVTDLDTALDIIREHARIDRPTPPGLFPSVSTQETAQTEQKQTDRTEAGEGAAPALEPASDVGGDGGARESEVE